MYTASPPISLAKVSILSVTSQPRSWYLFLWGIFSLFGSASPTVMISALGKAASTQSMERRISQSFMCRMYGYTNTMEQKYIIYV